MKLGVLPASSMQIELKKEYLFSLTDWIRLYDNNRGDNYAIEFLSAATDGSIAIPNSQRYHIPPDVAKKNIDFTLEQAVRSSACANAGILKERIRARKKNVRTLWKEGIKPWAIKSMDLLREKGDACFEIDLLMPKLYDGTEYEGNKLPYAIAALPGFSYLFGSALFSGQNTELDPHTMRPNPRSLITIYPSRRLPKKQLEEKIKGTTTEKRSEGVGLKQAHANVLHLLGLQRGRKSTMHYGDLGIGFIENLCSWLRKGMLGDMDKGHTLKTLYRFMEALIDHRYGVYARPEIYLPGFRKEETNQKFKEFILDMWEVVNPDIPLRTATQQFKGTHYTHLILKAEDAPVLEARFPARTGD